jgi:hypothetical protein
MVVNKNVEALADEREVFEEDPILRGTVPLPNQGEPIFSKKIALNVDQLPAWEPYVVIDSDHFEDDEI